jgi:hypothetical protein
LGTWLAEDRRPYRQPVANVEKQFMCHKINVLNLKGFLGYGRFRQAPESTLLIGWITIFARTLIRLSRMTRREAGP